MSHQSPYRQAIVEDLATLGHAPGAFDPRHLEAYMRLGRGTLDALSRSEFLAEVALAVLCVREGGTAEAEAAAQSFGM